MKVFLSYHRDDSKYKNKVISILKKNGIKYYAVPYNYHFDGKYHKDIARIIIENIKDCDVTVCIIGKETYKRSHIDHELKATLTGGTSIRKGLLGIMLENRGDRINNIDFDTIPIRISKNLKECEYAELIQFANFEKTIVNALKRANESRCLEVNVVNNMPVKKLINEKYYENMLNNYYL